MTAEQSVLERLRLLPPERRREVLDFVEFLLAKTQSEPPRRSLLGLCADLGVHITAEEIDEARAEMWSGFPRAVTS